MATANRLYSPGENIYGACASPTTTTRLMCYDQSGNLIRDKYVTNAAWMTYDAVNKMSRHNVNDAQDDTIIYTYDADGKRKSAYIGTATTYYIHGLGGELLYETQGKSITEYGYRNGELLVTAKSASRTTDTRWLVTDQLGTPSIVADQTGNLSAVKRHDYLPFGEEIGSTVGGRNTTQGYGTPQSDGVRQQFTGYERDAATGLDFAEARYMGSSLGRFTSVDPENAGASDEDPQSWNGYAYSRNNPTLYTDPDGREFRICYSGIDCNTISDKDFAAAKINTGYLYENGNIYDLGENENGGNRDFRGTYERVSFDDLSVGANELIFGPNSIGDQGVKKGKLVGALAGGAVVVGGCIALCGPAVAAAAPLVLKAVLGIIKIGGKNLKIRPDVILKGGRSGQNVKNLVSEANSVVKGAKQGRVYVTDQSGKVILDITKDRVKEVGLRGFVRGSERPPTADEIQLIKSIWK